jgi:hypothetical protein
LVGPHITSKTSYVAIASRRGEGRGNQLMSKTGYVEIVSRLVTVARSCFSLLRLPETRQKLVSERPMFSSGPALDAFIL